MVRKDRDDMFGKRVVRAALMLCGWLACAGGLPASAETSQVRVLVSSYYGDVLSADDFSRYRGRVILKRGEATVAVIPDSPVELEYGEYEVEAALAGFKTSRTRVVINQPDQIVRVALATGSTGALLYPCSISGRINPAAGESTVRLLSFFGESLLDVPAKPDGTFVVENLECGDYMLIALGPGGCLGLQFARLTQARGRTATEVEINVTEDRQSVRCGPGARGF